MKKVEERTLLAIARDLDDKGELGLVHLVQSGAIEAEAHRGATELVKATKAAIFILMLLRILTAEANNVLAGAREGETMHDVINILHGNIKKKYIDVASENKAEIQHITAVYLKHIRSQLNK